MQLENTDSGIVLMDMIWKNTLPRRISNYIHFSVLMYSSLLSDPKDFLFFYFKQSLKADNI